jgi:hypothetical protein
MAIMAVFNSHQYHHAGQNAASARHCYCSVLSVLVQRRQQQQGKQQSMGAETGATRHPHGLSLPGPYRTIPTATAVLVLPAPVHTAECPLARLDHYRWWWWWLAGAEDPHAQQMITKRHRCPVDAGFTGER